MRLLIFVCIFFAFNRRTLSLRNVYSINKMSVPGDNIGDPVFLTPFIESGKVNIGKALAEVKGILDGVRSYAGFFTVNKTTNSNLYFWFFPAEKSPETAPVVLWLQGGPGVSSLYGLFEENGPFYVQKNGVIKLRENRWTETFNVIYIDNPVGAGFSFTDSEDGYARDEVKIGEDLYSALSQFFKLFPNLAENDFFVTGESYAGKYIPAVAFTIHNKNKQAYSKINLKGIAIGNGMCDPENMLDYGQYLYQIGLIDANAKNVFIKVQNVILKYIRSGSYEKAFDTFDELLNGDLIPYKSTYFNYTGFSSYYNYLHTNDYSIYGNMDEYIQKDEIRRLIHVGKLEYVSSNLEVENHLKGDIMQSMRPWIQELLENYRVLFYSGQLDIIVPYPLTLNFLQSLEWSGSAEYAVTKRKQWWVGDQLAGYSKTAGNLIEVLVRNAGHMVPADQPLWAINLIKRFTSNTPF